MQAPTLDTVSTPAFALSTGAMDLKKPLILLAVVGSLVACGDNTNLQRGETNCDSKSQDATNPHDASCKETGSVG